MEVVRGLFRLKSWWVALLRAVVFTFPARLVPVRFAAYRVPCDFSYILGHLWTCHKTDANIRA